MSTWPSTESTDDNAHSVVLRGRVSIVFCITRVSLAGCAWGRPCGEVSHKDVIVDATSCSIVSRRNSSMRYPPRACSVRRGEAPQHCVSPTPVEGSSCPGEPKADIHGSNSRSSRARSLTPVEREAVPETEKAAPAYRTAMLERFEQSHCGYGSEPGRNRCSITGKHETKPWPEPCSEPSPP